MTKNTEHINIECLLYFMFIIFMIEVRNSYIPTMADKVVQPTSKGQITLPKEWRKKFPTDNFLIKQRGATLEIVPVFVDELEDEEVIFDADRDNDGKGLSPDTMIELFKKAGHHE